MLLSWGQSDPHLISKLLKILIKLFSSWNVQLFFYHCVFFSIISFIIIIIIILIQQTSIKLI